MTSKEIFKSFCKETREAAHGTVPFAVGDG
jgi:hypothetical protein